MLNKKDIWKDISNRVFEITDQLWKDGQIYNQQSGKKIVRDSDEIRKIVETNTKEEITIEIKEILTKANPFHNRSVITSVKNATRLNTLYDALELKNKTI